MDNEKEPVFEEARFLARKAKCRHDLRKLADKGPEMIVPILRRLLVRELEFLEKLDRNTGGTHPDIRRDYLLACDNWRRRQGCLSGYLDIVFSRRSLGLEEVSRRVGVAERKIMAWLLGDEVPSEGELETVILKLALTSVEERRLRKLWGPPDPWWDEEPVPWDLCNEAVFGTNDPEIIREKVRKMADVIEASEKTVGTFLSFKRQMKGASVEEMADRAGMDECLWRDWEEERVVPSLLEVEALGFRIFYSSSVRERFLRIRRAMDGFPERESA